MLKHHLINSLTSFLRRFFNPHFILASVLSTLPVIAFAQSANDITLRFANGQDSISGTLTDFKDNKFFIEASIGLVVIPTDGVFCVGDACPEGTVLEVENAQVILTSKESNVRISGDLIEIANNEYVLATEFGVQRIAMDLVNCEGADCLVALVDQPVDKTVELSSGGVTLRGTLLGFRDDSYILNDEVMGEIRVSALKFVCSGPGCP